MTEPPIDERYEVAADLMALRADNERLRGVVSEQLETLQQQGTPPHCPTCKSTSVEAGAAK